MTPAHKYALQPSILARMHGDFILRIPLARDEITIYMNCVEIHKLTPSENELFYLARKIWPEMVNSVIKHVLRYIIYFKLLVN